MKHIRVVKTSTALVSTSGMNLIEANNLAGQARMNRLQVIEGASTG
jgi:hypothetical protein